VRKGCLRRRKTGRAFVYSPEASRDAMRRAAIRELVYGFFDGSEEELIRFLRDSETESRTAASHGGAESIDTILL
jgi:predicted transcriptional regulator